MTNDEFLEDDNLQGDNKDLSKDEIEAPEGKYAAIGVDKDRTFIGILKLDERGATRTSNVKELISPDRAKEFIKNKEQEQQKQEPKVETNSAHQTEQEQQETPKKENQEFEH